MRTHKFIIAFAALTAAAPLRAVTVANFSGGNDTTNGGAATPSVDTFLGTAGSGWQTPWQKTTGGGTFTGTVVSTTPLNGGGNYLSATTSNAAGAGEAWSRQYGGAGDSVSLSQQQVISWDLRVDESAASIASNFTTGSDRYQIIGDAAAQGTTATSNTWIVIAAGADPSPTTTGFAAKHWEFYNGSTAGTGFNAGTLADSGMTITSGTTYHFTITSNPATKTYVGSVSDGTTTFTTGTLNWRNYSLNPTSSGGYLNFSAVGDLAGDARAFSLDNISVTPEPGSGALAVAGCAAALFRRRRGRPA